MSAVICQGSRPNVCVRLPSTTKFTTTQGGLTLLVDELVSETPNPTMRRVDLAVADARDPGRVLTHLTAYVAK